MDANTIFKTILQQIESSSLNYSLSKTPFSASISLKSSFVKRFKSEGKDIKHEINLGRSDVEKLRQENLELKASMKTLSELLNSQKKVINDNFKEAKDKDKIVEEQSAAYREELIKIKKEKNKLGADVKSLQVENDHFKSEIKFIKEEADECRKSMNKSTKKHEETVRNIEKDKELLKAGENNLKKQILDMNQQVEKFQALKVRTDSGNQTESENRVFEEFNCFYCDEEIVSEDKLEEHATNCQNVFESLISLPSMYLEQWEQWPCDIGEAKCSEILDLERHKTSNHQQDMREPYNPYYNEEDLKCCDFCGKEFGTLGGLRNHIRSLHREMLPT